MTLLIIIASLGLLAGGIIIRSLWKTGVSTEASRAQYDLLVYKDQLGEVAKDQERGLLGEEEVKAATTEIKRRMLGAASEKAEIISNIPSLVRRITALSLGVAVILLSLGVYLRLGSPQLPDMPHSERMKAETARTGEIGDMVERLAAKMRENPSDSKGWAMLARSYNVLGRPQDALGAYKHLLQIDSNDSDAWAGYGETMVIIAEGEVSPEAAAMFTNSLKANKNNPTARFYLGLAAEQQGNPKEAIAIWRDLERYSKEGDPWLPMLKESIAEAAQNLGVDPVTILPHAPNL